MSCRRKILSAQCHRVFARAAASTPGPVKGKMALSGFQVLSVDELKLVLQYLGLRDIISLFSTNWDHQRLLLVSNRAFQRIE